MDMVSNVVLASVVGTARDMVMDSMVVTGSAADMRIIEVLGSAVVMVLDVDLLWGVDTDSAGGMASIAVMGLGRDLRSAVVMDSAAVMRIAAVMVSVAVTVSVVDMG